MSEQSQGPGWWLASDGKWYPPESHISAQAAVAPPPPIAPSPAPPPQRSWLARRWWLVVGIVAVVFIAAGYAASSSDTNTETTGTGLSQRTEVECEHEANFGCTEIEQAVECVRVAQAMEVAADVLPDGVDITVSRYDAIPYGDTGGYGPVEDDWVVMAIDDQGAVVTLLAVPPGSYALEESDDEQCRQLYNGP